MFYETGAPGDLDLSALVTPTITGALTDPQTQLAINESIATALESEEVKASIRPYMIEAGAWVLAGVLAAIVLGKRL